MSIRRMMLFTLGGGGGIFKSIINLFKTRVLSDVGNFEAETNLENQLNTLGSTLFDSASLIITPNGYKENVLFSVTPSPVGTNLLLRSEEFENSYWRKTSCTISTNQEIAPNGTLTADYVVEDNTTGLRYVGVVGVPTTIGQTYTFSFFAKKKDRSKISFQINEGNALFPTAIFDFDTETFTRTTPLMTSSFQSVGNGWFRLIFTRTPTTGTSSVFGIHPLDVNGNMGQQGDGVSRTIIWGAQLEIGTSAGNYIPTTTRQAINETICDLSVTRATTATRVNEQGLIEIVPYNILSYSEEISNNVWSKSDGSGTRVIVIENQGVSPRGDLTADLVVPTADYKEHAIIPTISLSSLGINRVDALNWSTYVKPAGNNFFILRTNINNSWVSTIFNIQNGTIVSTHPNFASSNITNYGNGWYRISVVTQNITNYDSFQMISTPTGDITFSGDGVSGAYMWGSQITKGEELKEYYQTTNRQNIPRIDYTNGSPSILIEPQRTNLSLQSEDFTNGWSQEGTSVLSNTQISPDGALTADSIFELATNDVHRTYRSTAITVTANQLYCASFFVKKNNVRWVRVVLTKNGSTTIWAGAQFDLDTKTFTSQVGIDGGVFSSASITSLVNGWYRINVVGSIPGTGMFPMLALSNGSALLNTDTRGCPIYLGNANNELYVWGGQLELGSSITSYIPTTTSTVTRNADIISNTNAYNLIGQTEGTVFVDYNKVLANDTFRGIISLNDGTTSNLIEIWDGVGSGNLGRIVYIYYANNLGKVTGAGQPTISPSGRYKICLTYIITPSLVNIKFFINGVKLDDRNLTYTAFSSPLTRINIGNRNSIGIGVGGHNLDFILKTRITDQQAIQLTTL